MKTREKVKKNIEEGTHYYAGQKKGYWWKYLLAFLIIAIYLIPLYVLFMQSFKSMSDGSTALGFPEVVWSFAGCVRKAHPVFLLCFIVFHKIGRASCRERV